MKKSKKNNHKHEKNSMVSYSQLLNLKSEYKSRKKSNYAFPVILSLFMFGIAYFLTRVLWFSMIIPSAILLGTAGFAYKEHKDNMREKQKLLIPQSEKREKYLKNSEKHTFKRVNADSMRDDIISHYNCLKKTGIVLGIILIAIAIIIGCLIYLAYRAELYIIEVTPFFLFSFIPPVLFCIAVVFIACSVKDSPEKIYENFCKSYVTDIIRTEHSYMGGNVIDVNGYTLNIGTDYLIILTDKVVLYKYSDFYVILESLREKKYDHGVYSNDEYKFIVHIVGNERCFYLKTDEHIMEMLCDEFMRHSVKIIDKRRF